MVAHWTEKEIELKLALLKQGKDYHEIAALLGRTYYSVISKLSKDKKRTDRKNSCLPKRGAPIKFGKTKEEVGQWRELMKKGKYQYEVAGIIGCSPGTISRKLYDEAVGLL